MNAAEVWGVGIAVATSGILGFAFGAVAAGAATERRRVMGAPSMFDDQPALNVSRVLEIVRAARSVVETWDDYEACKIHKERLARALGQ